MLRSLDTLGDDLETELARQTYDASNDRPDIRVVDHLRDEAAVDLQNVERKLVKNGERGVAGPEVVECNQEPPLLQAAEKLCDDIGTVDERGLGNLEVNPRRVDTRFSQKSGQIALEIRVEQVLWREVDVDRQVGASVV